MNSFALTEGIFMKIKDSSKLLISRYERNIDYQNTRFPGIQTRSLALLWPIRGKILTVFDWFYKSKLNLLKKALITIIQTT